MLHQRISSLIANIVCHKLLVITGADELTRYRINRRD